MLCLVHSETHCYFFKQHTLHCWKGKVKKCLPPSSLEEQEFTIFSSQSLLRVWRFAAQLIYIYIYNFPINSCEFRLMDFLHIASSGGWSVWRLYRWWYSDCNPECNWSKIRIVCSRRRFLNMFLSMFVRTSKHTCVSSPFLILRISNYSHLIPIFSA